MITELELNLINYYKKYPELILKIGPWESIISCTRCNLEIPKDHPCLTYSQFTCPPMPAWIISKHSCPHCFANNQPKSPYKDGYYYRMKPISITIIYRRFITTKITKKWFKKDVIDGFWEYKMKSTEDNLNDNNEN